MIQFDEHIFQMGGKNHQSVKKVDSSPFENDGKGSKGRLKFFPFGEGNFFRCFLVVKLPWGSTSQE